MFRLLAFLTATLIGIVSASASTVCFNPTDSTCTPGTESMVFLEAGTHTTILGNIGSQTGTPILDITSTTTPQQLLDAANGFANIKPNTGDTIGSLAITLPGGTFTDLEFSVQMFNIASPPSTGLGFTIDVKNGNTLLGTTTYSGLKHDADLDFFLLSSLPITEVDLVNTTGFKEVKHFEVSGVTPIPTALPLFASGLGAMGLLGLRRKRKNTRSIASA